MLSRTGYNVLAVVCAVGAIALGGLQPGALELPLALLGLAGTVAGRGGDDGTV